MALEIEAKFRVASHEPVRVALRGQGAALIGRVMETNTTFDRPDGSLRRAGCGLRVRSSRAEDGGELSGGWHENTGGQAVSGTRGAGTGGQAVSGTQGAGTGGQAASGTQGAGTGGQAASGIRDGGDTTATLTYKGPVIPGPIKSREELEVVVGDADAVAEILRRLGFVHILRFQKRRESWSFQGCRIELDEPPHIGLFVEIEGPDAAAIAAVQRAIGLSDVPHVQASYVRMLMEYCDEHRISQRIVTLLQ